MQQDLDNIFGHLLDIVGYADDKQVFIAQFKTACQRQAFADILASLPKEKQHEIQQQAIPTASAEEMAALLGEITSPDHFTNAIQTAAAAMLQEYLDAIAATITSDQRERMQEYLTSLAATGR